MAAAAAVLAASVLATPGQATTANTAGAVEQAIERGLERGQAPSRQKYNQYRVAVAHRVRWGRRGSLVGLDDLGRQKWQHNVSNPLAMRPNVARTQTASGACCVTANGVVNSLRVHRAMARGGYTEEVVERPP